MASQVPWTALSVEEFIALGALTDDEERILRTRVRGWSRSKQAIEFDMSLATVDRIIRRLKVKYDRVQPFSVHLPPRRHSAAETWMDTH